MRGRRAVEAAPAASATAIGVTVVVKSPPGPSATNGSSAAADAADAADAARETILAGLAWLVCMAVREMIGPSRRRAPHFVRYMLPE